MVTEADYPTIALILSIITALAVSIAATASVLASRSAKKLGRAQLMEGIDDALKDAVAKEVKLLNENADLQSCDNYITSYLNAVDRIAYTKNQGAFDKSVIDYYKPFLKHGLLLLEWKSRTYGKDVSKVYANLLKVCKKEDISKPEWTTLNILFRTLAEHLEKKRENAKKSDEEKTKSENTSASQDKTQLNSKNS